jgi:hypothetical protein
MPACTFKADTKFITNTEVAEGELLSINDTLVIKEFDKGFHKNSGKPGFKTPMYGEKVPLSPILNHCFLVKASSKMAKEYLKFMKEAGCTEDELDKLGAKIEVFASATDLNSGSDDKKLPQPAKKLEDMTEMELQATAQDMGIDKWDTMNKKELLKNIKRKM